MNRRTKNRFLYTPTTLHSSYTNINHSQEYKIINASVRIDWPGSEKPADQPICGFLNEACPKDSTHITSMVVAGVLGLVLFCAGVITMSIYRKWKIELEIEGLLWKIDPQEIKGYFGNDIISSPSKVICIKIINKIL